MTLLNGRTMAWSVTKLVCPHATSSRAWRTRTTTSTRFPGRVFRSTDGLRWAEYATIGDTNQHLFLDYRDGLFVAYGDTNTSFVSEDALNWEVLPGIDQATYCEGEFKSAQDCHNDSWFAGAYYRAEWGGIIKRSTDGSRYVEVYVDDSGNNLYRSRAISQGYAAP